MSIRETIDFSWRSEASCINYDVNDFYPERGKPVASHIREACESCPVKTQCLNHALLYEKHGFWGGTTEQMRRTIRRKSGIRAVSPESLYISSEARLRESQRRAPKHFFQQRGSE